MQNNRSANKRSRGLPMLMLLGHVVLNLSLAISLTAVTTFSQDVMKVCSAGGVNLRQEASTTSVIVKRLEYGTEVYVLDTMGYTYSSGVFEGKWFLVTDGHETGYLVNLYLTSLPLPTAYELGRISFPGYIDKYFSGSSYQYEEAQDLTTRTSKRKYLLHAAAFKDVCYIIGLLSIESADFIPFTITTGSHNNASSPARLFVTAVGEAANLRVLHFSWQYPNGELRKTRISIEDSGTSVEMITVKAPSK